MEYRQLGSSGLAVSRLILGCMAFGDPGRKVSGRVDHSLTEEESRVLIRAALDAGITTFDTANVYSEGASEEILGRALRDFARRDDVVIATKVWGRMRPGPYGMGLSRKAILAEIDASLRRLGTDFIDLYQIHRLDSRVPIPEVLEALEDAVRSGKVRYLGASSMAAWQLATMLGTAELQGWSSFVSMQDRYNLLYREEEREMLPLCQERGLGVITWSPLSRGRLAREGEVATTIPVKPTWADAYYAESDSRIIAATHAVAARHHTSMATVALAWLLRRPAVTAPIIGASKPHHLDAALEALSLVLGDDDVLELDAGYMPRPVSGF